LASTGPKPFSQSPDEAKRAARRTTIVVDIVLLIGGSGAEIRQENRRNNFRRTIQRRRLAILKDVHIAAPLHIVLAKGIGEIVLGLELAVVTLIGRRSAGRKMPVPRICTSWRLPLGMARAGFGVDAQADFIDFMGAERTLDRKSKSRFA